jgi:hypothetical protein
MQPTIMEIIEEEYVKIMNNHSFMQANQYLEDERQKYMSDSIEHIKMRTFLNELYNKNKVTCPSVQRHK